MRALDRFRDWLGLQPVATTTVKPPTTPPIGPSGISRALPPASLTGGPKHAVTLRDNEIFWLRGTVAQIHGYALTIAGTSTDNEDEQRIARTLLAITTPALERHHR